MNNTWTDERIASLTELWLDGVSAGLIAKQIGLTKCAVIGKAHRLELPGRGSPIDTSGKSPEKKARRDVGLARVTPQSEPTVPLRHRPCLFIAGERGTDFTLYVDARRCPEAARPGSPYCTAHHRLCHRRPATEEAA